MLASYLLFFFPSSVSPATDAHLRRRRTSE